MAITVTRNATKDTDIREINENLEQVNQHESIGGFFPENGTLRKTIELGEKDDFKIDSIGNLSVRGAVTTDEGAISEDFSGTTLHHVEVDSAITFTNGSRTVTSTTLNFSMETSQNDYFRLGTDTDSDYAKIESVISMHELLLTEPYTGVGGTGFAWHSQFKPFIEDDGSLSVATSIINISSGITGNKSTRIERLIDYCPLVISTKLSLSQRVANQLSYAGLSESTTASSQTAYFQFVGDDDLLVNMVSSSGGNEEDIETTQIQTLVPSSVMKIYRVEVQQEYVTFFIDGIMVATHKTHIPSPYASLNAAIGFYNFDVVDSETVLSVDKVFIGNINVMQTNTGAINTPVIVNNSFINPIYTRNANFEVKLEITRPADITGYAANDLINNDGSSSLPYFDFAPLGDFTNRFINLTTIIVISSNGTAVTKLDPFMHFFNEITLSGSDLTDNVQFNPTYDVMSNNRTMSIESNFTSIDHGDNCYLLQAAEKQRLLLLNAQSRLYLAMVTSASYTPTSGEKFTVVLKGYYE
jgi:hypothetical protein